MQTSCKTDDVESILKVDALTRQRQHNHLYENTIIESISTGELIAIDDALSGVIFAVGELSIKPDHLSPATARPPPQYVEGKAPQ